MQKSTSALFLSTESIEEYKIRKQEEVINLLETSKKLGKIDEVTHKRLLLETCDAKDWEGVFDHYLRLWGDIVSILANFEEQAIYNRLIKGAEMIEKETDPDKRRQYLAVYSALEKRLEEIRKTGEGRSA